MFLLEVPNGQKAYVLWNKLSQLISTEHWHFIIIFGIICGVNTVLLFTPSFAAIGHFFNRCRGSATGIAATGCAFGGVFFTLLLKSLIPRVGVAWATRVMGFIILFLCTFANLHVKPNLPRSPAAKSPHPDFRILSQTIFALTVFGAFLTEWALFVP
jgi:nitrate/nitrite transporter NarK